MIKLFSRQAARIGLILAILLAFLLGVQSFGVPSADAATLTVNDTSGVIATDGNCTLREAIIAANTDAVVDACPAGSGADTIELGVGLTYILIEVDNSTDEANGLPSISSQITINGNGSTIERSGAAPKFRIFHVGNSGVLTLNQVTVSGGFADGIINGRLGGGILNNSGTLTLVDSSVSANNADFGGGIANVSSTVQALMTLTNSAVSNNTIKADNLGSGGAGAGIYNASGAATLINSTVSGNDAKNVGGSGSSGGGIFNVSGIFAATVSLTNSTVSNNNSTFQGGGIHNAGSTVSLTNSIVAQNTGSAGGPDCFGPITSGGHNLLGNNSGCGFAPGAGDLVGTPGSPINPLLGPLQSNGGPTDTHALLAGSPALDAGDDAAAPATDQRGVARPQGAASDIGAFELSVNQNPPEVSADRDSILRPGAKQRNEGANPLLHLGDQRRQAVGFDLSGVDLGSVSSAKLVLTINDDNSPGNWGSNGRTVDVHRLLEDWVEGDGQAYGLPNSQKTRGSGSGVTWKCATDTAIENKKADCDPVWNGGNFLATPTDSVIHTNGLSGEVEWDVTADVLAGTDSWLIKKTQGQGNAR